jgi:pyruvate-formate lyase-activating enzyme
MLIIGNRKHEDRIDKLNDEIRILQHDMIRFESFHNPGTLKDIKHSAKNILRHISVLENAFKRETEKRRKKK